MKVRSTVLFPLASLWLGCAGPVPLDELGCPCSPGNSCRLEDSTCVEAIMPSPSDEAPRCTLEAPECSASEQYITDAFESPEQVTELLVGRWLACADQLDVDEDPTFTGIEFTDDHQFYFLRATGPDECERESGFGQTGSWYLLDISEQNAPGTYQVVLDLAGGGTSSIVPAFSAEPRKLQTERWGELVSDPQ